jgi:hypothetical protein
LSERQLKIKEGGKSDVSEFNEGYPLMRKVSNSSGA